MKIVARNLMLTLVALLSGCFVIAPVPSFSHRVTAGEEIKPEDVSFVKPGITTHSEVSQRFGQPWAFYPELGVSVYYWEVLRGHLFRAIGVDMAGVSDVEQITRLHVLLVQFDDSDRVQKYEIMKHPRKTRTKDLAARWVGSK